MAKLLIVLGIIFVGLGLILHFGIKIPWIGRLPGDILIQRENFTFYFPLTTGILISIVVMIVY
nr:DUF2905 domain-containing protein [Saprospiraceae bacterium]